MNSLVKPSLDIHKVRRWWRKKRSRQIWRMAKLALPITRERLNAFMRLKTISLDVRRNLMPRLIHYEAQLALIAAMNEVILNRFMILLIPVIIAICITPYAIIYWYGNYFGWVAFIGIWFASLFTFVVLGFLIVAPIMLFYYINEKQISTFLAMFWLSFGLITYGFAFYYIHTSFGIGPIPVIIIIALTGIAQTLIYLSGATFLALIAFLTMVLSLKLKIEVSTAMFVDKILHALEIVEQTERSWDDLRTKNRLMKKLEEAARIVDEKIPKALRTYDPYTDLWQRDRFGEIAASLRAKKHWVCIPKSDTRDHLEQSLAKCFIDAAFGRWDSLETAERRTARRVGMQRLRIFIFGLLVALLPAGVFRVALLLGFVTSGPLSNYLNFGVVLWAVIALLFAIDPRFGEKIEAVGKLTSIIPGLSKKKEI